MLILYEMLHTCSVMHTQRRCKFENTDWLNIVIAVIADKVQQVKYMHDKKTVKLKSIKGFPRSDKICHQSRSSPSTQLDQEIHVSPLVQAMSLYQAVIWINVDKSIKPRSKQTLHAQT